MPIENEMLIRIASTIITIAIIILLRNISLKMIKNRDFHHKEAKMRAMVYTRKFFMLLVILTVAFIWLSHIKDFALSITALAVAIVLATKELILCVTGGMIRNYSQSYRIGDRIHIGDYRGDVVNIDLLSTTLLEIGPGVSSHQYTGRSINIPNGIFLSHPLINETFTEKYILHVFSVPISSCAKWQEAEKVLLEAANETVQDYIEEARKHMEKLSSRTAFEAPNVDPRVTIIMADKDTLNLLVRVPVPSRRKGKIEQAIVRLFLEKYDKFGYNPMIPENS
ncbi:MscS Mechanosensitive ion channel [Denitrovibrio acetiphilus DSM 12809]|uniref:MscS Mechanosensitive ion channel n=1 Tax=Denitrovibrio acetiphilus (strain DSM 12809 / NBRC 114555 / N2460) TaxID=522772 RepID=D4H143_DENA2|nr:mechanosensitive ion channel family protein [Denitrovibrio acetiphilus]ADD68706.1 MscS Mechanosensitive ion channel [Denitrovibrio acetiphilus DSM 12809]